MNNNYLSMPSQTFAEAVKKSAAHWKMEVSSTFLVSILEQLLERHGINQEEFHNEMKVRFNVVRIHCCTNFA